MTPQWNFMVVAPIAPDRMEALKALLASMTDEPGMAKPDNAIVPFKLFDTLHYARFVILDDQTLGDFKEAGERIPHYPVTLAFLGDCDEPGDLFLAKLAERACAGLREIFAHCADFSPNDDLVAWMKRHSQRPAAAYVNYVGRTVRQIHQEAALRDAVVAYLKANPPAVDNPQGTRKAVIDFVQGNRLNPPLHDRTPLDWWVRKLMNLLILPAIAAVLAAVLADLTLPGRVLLLCFLVFLLILFLWLLRWYEKTEPEIIHQPTDAHAAQLAAIEDYDVTNQFTVIGSVKPSLFRRLLLIVLLWVIGYAARHFYTCGHLGRVRSIHFARWVFLNGYRRVMFASNYDGSLDSYMDDFINKVGFGLNLAFGSGLGYPRTNWLIGGGSKKEQKFKYTLRRHQVPTQVWYKAYPGMTAYDLTRNARVRQGIEARAMSDAKIRAWLRDL
jgi:hypothetical protein